MSLPPNESEGHGLLTLLQGAVGAAILVGWTWGMTAVLSFLESNLR